MRRVNPKTTPVMTAEVVADCYSGDNCNESKNYFNIYCEGDKQDGTDRDDIVIEVDTLPPGTKISVEYPICPDCGLPRQDMLEPSENGEGKVSWRIVGHESPCECGFDWDNWVLEKYS